MFCKQRSLQQLRANKCLSAVCNLTLTARHCRFRIIYCPTVLLTVNTHNCLEYPAVLITRVSEHHACVAVFRRIFLLVMPDSVLDKTVYFLARYSVNCLACNYICYYILGWSPMAVRSKAWDCGRSLAGIGGSNPPGGMDVCML